MPKEKNNIPPHYVTLINEEIFKKLTTNDEEAVELFRKFISLAKDENCTPITLKSLAHILTDFPDFIESKELADIIVTILSNELDVVDFMNLNAELIPYYFSSAPDKASVGRAEDDDSGDCRRYLVMELMKGQIKQEQSAEFVKTLLFPEFKNLSQLIINHFLELKHEKRPFNLYADETLFNIMLSSANEYIKKLEIIKADFSTLPAGIRANCNMAMHAILKILFPHNKPSKNKHFNNKKMAKFKGSRKNNNHKTVPRAALGFLLLYLNLRLMGLFIDLFIGRVDENLTKKNVDTENSNNNLDNYFNESTLSAALSNPVCSAILGKRIVKKLRESPLSIFDATRDLAEKIKRKHKKINSAKEINNPYITYLRVNFGLTEDEKLTLKTAINSAIYTVYDEAVNNLVNYYKQNKTEAGLSQQKQLAYRLYMESYYKFRAGYRGVLAGLSNTDPTELVIETEQQDKGAYKVHNSLSDSSLTSLSQSDNRPGSSENNSPFVSLSDTDQHTGEWALVAKRLAACEQGTDLTTTILDAFDLRKKYSEEESEIKPEEIKMIDITSAKQRHQKFYNLFFPKSDENTETDMTDEISIKLNKLMKSFKDTEAYARTTAKIYKENPKKFTEFFENHLLACMNALTKNKKELAAKLIFFRGKLKPFFEFSRRCLNKKEDEMFVTSIEKVIQEHELSEPFKNQLRGKRDGLGLSVPPDEPFDFTIVVEKRHAKRSFKQ